MSDLKSYWQDKYPSAFCWSFGDSPALADELAALAEPAARLPAISRSSRP